MEYIWCRDIGKSYILVDFSLLVRILRNTSHLSQLGSLLVLFYYVVLSIRCLMLFFISDHSMIQLVGDGNGMIGMPLATAFFLLVYKIKISNNYVSKALASISKASLDMYLSSYMFDVVIYSYLISHYYVNQSQFGLWFFLIVPTVFSCSYIFAIIKRTLFHLLHLPTK